MKILRPGIAQVIAQGRRAALRARGSRRARVAPTASACARARWCAEFEKTIGDELDLVREAANASQLRRNFADGRLLIVPEVYWDWCNRDVMVMERIDGIPVNARRALRARGIDIPKLARDGVEIFFTQVFRDGFFHADMHPGNIFVARRRALLRRRLRHHGHALGRGQELPRAPTSWRSSSATTAASRSRAHRRGLGAARHARGRVRGRDPLGVRADLRPAAEGDLLRQAAAAALRGLAALPHGDPAAARAAAEDAAAGRGPRAPARSRTSTCGATAQPILERFMRRADGRGAASRGRCARRLLWVAHRCRSCRDSRIACSWTTRRAGSSPLVLEIAPVQAAQTRVLRMIAAAIVVLLLDCRISPTLSG